MSYISFKNKYLGKKVDYDGVYGFQCVDLVKQYLAEEYGLKPGAWGDAIDYWYNTNPAVLKEFDRLSTNQARQGDIVILKGINGNPYGHIGIADGSSGILTVTILEQNGATGNGSGLGGDAIRTRAVPLWRVVGLLRPRTAKPAIKMPPVGSKIQLIPKDTRNTYKAGTTKKAGTIRVTDNTFIYTVRGYDPVYGGRILINSASAGGDGVALALFYTNSVRIEGWRQI